MNKWLLILGLLLPSGLPAQQTTVYGKIEIEPPPVYKSVYNLMEDCTGIKGDFSAVRWAIADFILVFNEELSDFGIPAIGMWTDASGYPEIILVKNFALELETVSHEITHDLFKGDVPMDVAQTCLLRWQRLTPRRPG